MRSSRPSLTDEIKRLATLAHLRRLVEEDAGPPVGGSRRWRCPIHDGGDPNFAVYLSSQSGQPRWRCHSQCNRSGSIIDYFVLARGFSIRAAVHEAARVVGAATGSARIAPPRRRPRRSQPKQQRSDAPAVDWERRFNAMRLVPLTDIGWLDEWLSERRLTHEHLRVGMVIGAQREQGRDFWTGERCLYEVPEGVLMCPAYDGLGAVRGWQTRHRKKPEEDSAHKQTASGCEVLWCGGGRPEWWPDAERVIVVASPSDRLALIAAGHGHNPILGVFGDNRLRAAVLHARETWLDLPINVVLDKDAHDKGAKAIAGVDNVTAVGCTGSDVGEIWAEKGRLILPF